MRRGVATSVHQRLSGHYTSNVWQENGKRLFPKRWKVFEFFTPFFKKPSFSNLASHPAHKCLRRDKPSLMVDLCHSVRDQPLPVFPHGCVGSLQVSWLPHTVQILAGLNWLSVWVWMVVFFCLWLSDQCSQPPKTAGVSPALPQVSMQYYWMDGCMDGWTGGWMDEC